MITYTDWVTPEEIREIEQTVLVKEQYVLSLPTPWENGFKGLTNKFAAYNWLDDFDFLVPKLQKILETPHHVQCWANVLREGEGVPKHKHAKGKNADFKCGNLFISGEETIGTTYDWIGNVHNVPGELHWFGCHLPHKVPANTSKKKRISLAFDCHKIKRDKKNALISIFDRGQFRTV
jgi:hypothetical protein